MHVVSDLRSDDQLFRWRSHEGCCWRRSANGTAYFDLCIECHSKVGDYSMLKSSGTFLYKDPLKEGPTFQGARVGDISVFVGVQKVFEGKTALGEREYQRPRRAM